MICKIEPLVSIIVPIYNAEKYLDECINSILQQTYLNIECILVDDGSTDSSGSICDKYAEIDQRVKIIHKINGGVISARKQGVKNAIGMWVYFIDADDTICSDTIKCMLMNANDDVDIVMFEENENEIIHREDYLSGLLKRSIRWSNCGKLYRKNLFDDYVFATSRYFNVGEDFLTSLRITKNLRNHVVISSSHKYNYRIVDSSTMSQYRHEFEYEQRVIAEVNSIIKSLDILDINVKEAHFHYNTMMLGGLIGLNLLKNFNHDWIKNIVNESKSISMNFHQKITIRATQYNLFRYVLIIERTLKEFLRKLFRRR